MLTFQPVDSPETIPLLQQLAKEIQIPYFTPMIGEAQITYMLDLFLSKQAILEQLEKGYQYRLVQSDGKLCGYFGICPEGEKLFLSKFYLKEEFRGKGIGRTGFQHAPAVQRHRQSHDGRGLPSGRWLTICLSHGE